MNIDIRPNGAIKRVHVSQNDVGRTLTFNLFNESLAYTIPNGATVKIQGTKPSGFGFSETCSVSGNTVTIDTTEEMTDEFGYIETELVIESSGDVLGTSNFILAVERNPHPSNTTDGTQITAQSLQSQIDALQAEIESGGSGLTDEAKQALLNCLAHVAWIDGNGQSYYDALESALYPTATLVSISAVYTQSGIVYNTDSLDDLKADLIVTAHYDNGTTQTVTSYTLSGTLTEGTSTITVTYSGKTTTFNVTVSAETIMINGYHASNNSIVASCGPYALHYDSVYTYDHTKLVTSIELNVTTAGKMTILITPLSSFSGNNVNDNWANVIIKDTLYIENTGFQRVYLNEPFIIPSDYVLVIGGGVVASGILDDPDTCLWKYGTYGTQKGFGYVNSSSNKSLGINVYVTEAPISESLWINGYSDSNVTQAKSQYAPFYLTSNHYTIDTSKPIVAIELNIHTIGNLSIGHEAESQVIGKGTINARNNFVLDETLTFTQTGKQKVYLTQPITLATGECFAIGSTTDTAIFLYGDNGVDKRFYYCGSGSVSENSNQSLGLNIYVEG